MNFIHPLYLVKKRNLAVHSLHASLNLPLQFRGLLSPLSLGRLQLDIERAIL